jgi:hypothetical protein
MNSPLENREVRLCGLHRIAADPPHQQKAHSG